MLFPRTHAWTRKQRWLIVACVVAALGTFATAVFFYERYDRGPSEAVLFGTWHGTVDWHGSDFYIQFRADHTFSIWDRAWFEDADKKPEFVTKGRWHAGGRFLYLRYPPEFRPDGRMLQFWLIDDISPQELRMRYWRDGGIHIFHRVDTRASNHAMERTATRGASTLWLASASSLRAARALGGRRSSFSR